MGMIEKHDPGSFCWVELGTVDVKGAETFYGELFGWTFEDNCPGGECNYSTIRLEGLSLAGCYTLCEAHRAQGVPPHWMGYVAVEDVAGTAARAGEAGGQVLAGPMDVMDMGKMAVIRDPQGAVLSLWQPVKHGGSKVRDVPGAFCWNELIVKDPEAVLAFYKAVAGWDVVKQDMGGFTYYVFVSDDTMRGGMMALDPAWGEVPPHWAVYFNVTDCDAVVAKAESLGAKVHMRPTDIPGVGRFAVIADPQGAVFSVIKMEPPQCCGCDGCCS